MRRRTATHLVSWSLVLACGAAAVPAQAHAMGLLLPTRPDLEPLVIRYHRVHVNVRERSAETRVEQTFRNQTGQTLEATYIFPLPVGASVSGFAMWVNGRRQEGELLDSGRARRVYEQIVARMRDPGLVEYMGGNLFRARVFPIQPGAEQRIELRFTQTLDYEGGVIHYRYPLNTGGRAARTLEDLTIQASIVSRTPIRAVYSPSHRISVTRPDEHHATVAFEEGQAVLGEDFDLYYAVQDRDVGLSLLTHRVQGDAGYFVAMIAPRTEVTQREIAAKEVLFVFDTSGSMAGEKLERAQAALDYMLSRLNASDFFQVVRFSTDVELLFDGGGSVAATPQNVLRARGFAGRFVAAGGTAIDAALTEAFRGRAPPGDLPRMVVFLTDGMPTIGETNTGRIVEHARGASGSSRLFAFGVGDDVNTTFLDQLAQANRGVGDYFRDGREMERRLSSFYDRIAYPLLTDLRLEMPGLSAFDVYPRDLGHLYRGGQLFVVGRYRGSGASHIRLVGRASHERQPRRFDFAVHLPAQEADNDWLPRLWATRKVGYLLDQIRLRGERAELRDEVVSLSRSFGIVTPYTSYLVVDDDAIPPGLMPMTRATRARPFDRRRGPRFGPGTTHARAPAAEPSAPAQGGEAGADFEGFAEATSTYDFEDDVVAGGLARPDGELLSRPGRSRLGGSARAPRVTTAPAGGMGARGRAISRRVRSMREAQQSRSAESGLARFVGGRTFRLVRGMWVDSAYRRSMPTLRIRWGSPAYFALLRARPLLGVALTLGRSLTLTIGGGRAVRIEPGGPAAVSDDALRRFLSAAH